MKKIIFIHPVNISLQVWLCLSSIFEMEKYLDPYIQGVPETHVLGTLEITPLWTWLGTKVCFEKFRKFSN